MSEVTQLGQRGIGLNRVYTMEEVDALLAGLLAGQPVGGFTNAAPLQYSTPAITQDPEGTPLDEIVPNIVAGIPVVVNGKRYLIALMEE
jgi:hypothetical protein